MNQLGARAWLALTSGRGKDERGGSLVEYLLLVSLIAIVCLVAIMFFGEENSQTFSTSAGAIGEATNR